MNDIDRVRAVEERVRTALHARASAVTEESLRLPDDLDEPPRRIWPVLAAAAAVLVVIAGVSTVAMLGLPRGLVPAGPAPSSGEPDAGRVPPPCPEFENPCVVQTVAVNGETLELVAANAPDMDEGMYRNWVLRVRGGQEIGRGGVADSATENGSAPALTGHINAYVRHDSQRCYPGGDGDPSICLLETWDVGDTHDAYLLARTSSGWYFELRFGMSLFATEVHHADVDGKYHVVTVEHDPNLPDGEPAWWTHYWRLDGKALGCTRPVMRKEDLPGWPDFSMSSLPDDLGTDNCPIPPRDGSR